MEVEVGGNGKRNGLKIGAENETNGKVKKKERMRMEKWKKKKRRREREKAKDIEWE